MAYLSLSQFFLVFVHKRTVSLHHTSLLFPLLSPPPQHLANLQATIILALRSLLHWWSYVSAILGDAPPPLHANF